MVPKYILLLTALISSTPLVGMADSGNGNGASQKNESKRAVDNEILVTRNANAVRQIQQKLKSKSLYQGEVDGTWGPRTSNSLRLFQQFHGLAINGAPTKATLSALGFSPSTIAKFESQAGTPALPE